MKEAIHGNSGGVLLIGLLREKEYKQHRTHKLEAGAADEARALPNKAFLFRTISTAAVTH